MPESAKGAKSKSLGQAPGRVMKDVSAESAA
jgi:hypothetical protein